MSETIPHYPWSEGDKLFASALNAAIANSAAYGPFLPLTGGTLSRSGSDGWSGANVGKQLLISGGGNNPAVGIADATGGNIVGLVNASGALLVAGMPPQSDAASPINTIATFKPLVPSAPYVANQAQVDLFWGPTASGGSSSTVAFNTSVRSYVSGAPNSYNWNLFAQLNFQGNGGTGQHCALYTQAMRSTYAAGGGSNNPTIWGACLGMNDLTGQRSSITGPALGCEIDLACDDVDDANCRGILALVLGRQGITGAYTECHTGLGLTAVYSTDQFYNGFDIGISYQHAAINLLGSSLAGGHTGHTIWLNSGSDIAFDTAGNNTIWFDAAALSGNGSLRVTHNLTVTGALSTSNNLAVTGTSYLGGATTAAAAVTFQAGAVLTPAIASGPGDFSKHIDMYGGIYGFNVTGGFLNHVSGTTGGVNAFYSGATQTALISNTAVTSATALQVNGTSGPTWTSGSAAPASTQPVGSLYSRVGGAVGATLYVSRGAGTWAAVAGV